MYYFTKQQLTAIQATQTAFRNIYGFANFSFTFNKETGIGKVKLWDGDELLAVTEIPGLGESRETVEVMFDHLTRLIEDDCPILMVHRVVKDIELCQYASEDDKKRARELAKDAAAARM